MFKKLHKNKFLLGLKELQLLLRLEYKTKSQLKNEELFTNKGASDVIKYLENTVVYKDIKDMLPKSLLRKYKTPESMYLINRDTAKVIANTVKNDINNSPVIEVNPGLGLLTEQLLNCQKNHIYLYEASMHFTQQLHGLQSQYSNRITLKQADFFKMWKLAFQDKMDNGNRVQELLGNLLTQDNERVVKIIGSMPGLSFIKHLIYNIVFHNTTNQLGRPDLFITMPVHHYEIVKFN